MAKEKITIPGPQGAPVKVDPQDLWRIGEVEFLDKIKPLVPKHVYDLIESIKGVEAKALGPNIASMERASSFGDINIGTILGAYPELAKAEGERRVTKQDIVEAIPRIHYEGKPLRFSDFFYVLPRSLRANVNNINTKIEILDRHRIQLKKLRVRTIEESRKEIDKLEEDYQFWYDAAEFFRLVPDRPRMNIEYFRTLARLNQKEYIPFGLARVAQSFMVEDGGLAAADGGPLRGTFKIQSAAFYMHRNEYYPPRIVLFTHLHRKWSDESRIVQQREIARLKHAIVQVYEREGHSVRFPVNGGSFSGK